MNNQLSRDDIAFVVVTGMIVALSAMLYIGFVNSFEPATLQVGQRSWSTTSELYHYETEMVCSPDYDEDGKFAGTTCTPDTDKVVDERYIHHGVENDPITYHDFVNVRYGYHTSYTFSGNVTLIVNDAKQIVYKPDQNTYGKLARGAYCVGEVGWFNYVRRLNCSGR
jgi:hypothetical protein